MSIHVLCSLWSCRTAGGIQVQAEEEVSVELIEERERAIRQLEVNNAFSNKNITKFSPLSAACTT